MPGSACVAVFMLAGVGCASFSAAMAQTEVGDSVVLSGPEIPLKIGPRVVATGEVHRVFVIKRKQGAWLWLEAPELAGWVKADQVMPFDRALRDATARIEGGSPTAEAYNARGLLWTDRGRTDLAELDYAEAIRLDPDFSAPYLNRGICRMANGSLEGALSDLDEAAKRGRLDPLVYYNRSLARTALGQFDRAIEDLDLTLRLDAGHASAWFNRSALHLVVGRPLEAAADAQVFLKRVGWNEELSAYAAILAWAGASRGGNQDLARTLLDQALAHAPPSRWPYPILRHLQGAIDLPTLLTQAVSEDQKAEARAYAGIALQVAGKGEAASEQFQWVVRNADSSRLPFLLSRAALDRSVRPAERPSGP